MESLFCAFFVNLVLLQNPEPAQIRILEPGMYHGDEIDAEDGETWMGLFQTGAGTELRGVILHVKTVRDEIVDGDGEFTGKEVSVSGEPQPYLLIQGLGNTTEGTIKSAYRGDAFLRLGDTISITLDPADLSVEAGPAEIWHLGAVGAAVEGEHDILIGPYTLILARNFWSEEKESQEIVRRDQISLDGAPRLLWAGDIDRDNKIDLLFDLTDHYNVRALTLFLSSRAKPGELVGKAAELITTGC